jgi:class 3 adenylate cyclase/predicted ATPase
MNGHGDAQSPALRQAACAACGFSNPAAFRFCGGCGAALARGAAADQGEKAAAERPAPERRQLTVLFCDLVGSTRLAHRLDPEELREVIRLYQSVASSVIRRFDGTVSRFMGDGILALFGYPHAHEDDAERAVRAALDIVDAIATVPAPGGDDAAEALAVRIGIATGVVIVGDLIGHGASEEEAVVGETPNLAARLQGLAEPNSVVVAEGTLSLLGERFDCADFGMHALKGFGEPVRAWRVLAPRAAGRRLDVVKARKLTPLVGRKEELRELLALWHEAEQGRGSAILLAGEAGIGKSRVVEALRERIASASSALLVYQCSSHYVNTAMHPVIEHIESAAGIGREDGESLKLAKLRAWLPAGPESGEELPMVADLLSVPGGGSVAARGVTPERQKERTFELLLALMQRLAAARPLLVVFEDVHWADPTTLEFLTLVIGRVPDLAALVVLTFRPDFSPPWAHAPHVVRRELEKLAPSDVVELAEQVAGARRLPETVAEQVVAKADGVPLFVEELTRALLGTGLLSEHPDRYMLSAPLPALAIPSTLQDSLMARLDQLGQAKFVAQIAGAIGRSFSHELLQAVAPLPPDRLRDGLRVLEESGLVHAESGSHAGSYAFKHALVQEAAYQSLLRSRRRELHLRIAEVLESSFPQTARNAPELLAHHWTEAGVAERAVTAWLAAGQRASERSEYREAIGHLRRGLELVPRLAEAAEQRSRELALLLVLGPALMTAEGAGTPEVTRVYARALELCEAMPESASHFAAYWGWWRASMDHHMGRERADKLLGLARNLGDPELLLQAHHCQWATLYMLGAHDECCGHIEAGLGLYDPRQHRAHATLYGGHDAKVCALGERALARWLLGKPGAALEDVASALAWADALSHAGSRAHAMDYALVLHKFRRDAQAVGRCAADLIAYASEQKLRYHRAKGAFFRGWARAMLGEVPAGLSEMLDGIASEQESGTPEDFTLYYEMLAEVHARAGRYDEGLRALEDAFGQAGRYGIVFWNAELHRRRGELLLASGAPPAAAAACFREALEQGGAQGARSLELRAALSLARLHREQGERGEARQVLTPLYRSFSQGLDTPDLNEARQLLEVLA